MKKLLLFACIAIWCTCITLNAQTFHYIGFFDTNDARIGKHMGKDKEAIGNEMAEVMSAMSDLGYSVDARVYCGDSCCKSQLMNVLDSLPIKKNDIVFFFYGGHGVHSADEEDTDPFPQMCLGEFYQDDYVPASLVRNTFVDKGARLTIVFTGCCNKTHTGVTAKPTSIIKSAQKKSQKQFRSICKKLFVNQRGTVMMTSSQKEEYSFSNNYGSVFCKHLLPVWDAVKVGDVQADWRAICSKTKIDCSAYKVHYNEEICYQHPYYEIHLNEKDTTTRQPAATASRRETPQTGEMFAGPAGTHSLSLITREVNKLLDKSISVNERRQFIPSLSKSFFKDTPQIVISTEGNNRDFIYEDADFFLRRLVSSTNISEVRFYKQEKGKYYVYEYR